MSTFWWVRGLTDLRVYHHMIVRMHGEGLEAYLSLVWFHDGKPEEKRRVKL
jgi:hypothetical protein